MSLYDRIFRPRRYTLSDGTVVMEKHSRAPLVILILVVLTAVSVRITGFNFSVLVKKGSKFFDILKAMFPPNTAYLGKIWQPLLDTIKMSFLGSFIGAMLAIPFAIAAASNIVTNRVVVFLVRLFLSCSDASDACLRADCNLHLWPWHHGRYLRHRGLHICLRRKAAL